ncbi:hypothetical protein DQ04_23961000, partial [Trypanosoma grayi]|uniref:hypothetical protein n=1 Tax=Trypanosoma grayi TaxID=71804 RepID=UPI0004F48B72
MAVVQTHRFNWMGYEGTESETLNIALLRPSDMGHLRNNDCKQRQQIVADIRLRLKLIKRDLGLLPPEENGDAVKDTAAEDDAFLELDAESPARAREAEMAAQLAERRRKLLAKYGPVGDSDEDEEEEVVYLYPKPPSPAEVGAAMRGVSGGVK